MTGHLDVVGVLGVVGLLIGQFVTDRRSISSSSVLCRYWICPR